MDFKVTKNGILDSTWPDKKKAQDRAKTLKSGLRKQKIKGRPIIVKVEPCSSEDPKKYRKPQSWWRSY